MAEMQLPPRRCSSLGAMTPTGEGARAAGLLVHSRVVTLGSGSERAA